MAFARLFAIAIEILLHILLYFLLEWKEVLVKSTRDIHDYCLHTPSLVLASSFFGNWPHTLTTTPTHAHNPCTGMLSTSARPPTVQRAR